MKIIRVSFTNINSLAGSWTIDFDSPDFHSEAFVISGPTGSGKTSILDAISLAIFGKTARQSRGFSEKYNAIMTEGFGKCVAEADFIGTDGVRYRARWEQHRAKNSPNGALQPITRSISTVDKGDGTIAEIPTRSPSDAEEVIEKKAGLTFEQFVRAVVLQQGDFASFLTAKNDERADLLEKAVRDTRFSEAGRKVFQAFQKATDAKKQAETVLAERLGLGSGPSGAGKGRKAQRDDLEASIKKAQARLAEERDTTSRRRDEAMEASRRISEELDALQKEKRWVEDGRRLLDESRNLERRQDAAKEREVAFAGRRPAYERASRARCLDGAHREIERHREALATAERRRDELARRLDEMAGEKARRNAELQSATAERNRVADICANRREVLGGAAEVDRKLAEKTAELNAASNARNGAKREAEGKRRHADKAASEAVDLEELLLAAKSWRPGTPVPAKFATTKIFVALAAAAVAGDRLAEMAGRVEMARKEYNDARAKADAVRADNDRGPESTLSRLSDEAERARRRRDALKWSLELSKQRALLHDGDKCPLCGSTYHANAIPADLDKTVAEAERDVAAADQNCKAWQRRQNEIISAETGAAALLNSLQQELQNAQSAAEEAKHGAPIALERAKGNAEAARSRAIELESEAVSALESANALATEVDRLEGERAKLAEDFKRLLGGRTIRQEQESIDGEEKAAERAVVAANKNLAAIAARIDEGDRSIKDCNAEISGLSATLGERERDFLSAISGDFPDERAWAAARMDDADFASSRKMAEDLACERAEIETLAKSLSERKASHERAKPVDAPRDPAEIAAEIEERNRRKEDADREIGAAQAGLEDIEKADRGRKDAEEAWKAACDLHDKWKNLNNWFGGHDGNSFRVYAQGITLGKLIAEANGPLLSMTSGRYELDWDPADDKLVPVVVDHWQLNDHRPVSNVSGGETFLISLSLALGLGRLAGKELPIETLFLDEGFGTLDSEKLQLALKTLSDLHGAGCNVGVISHIDAVKAHGFDIIEVVPNGDATSAISGPGVSRG